MLPKKDRYFYIRLLAYAILTICILAGALTYASTINRYSNSHQKVAFTSLSTGSLDPLRVTTFAKTKNRERHSHPALAPEKLTKDNLQNLLLPVGTWFLGSALLAMIGYKRMRN